MSSLESNSQSADAIEQQLEDLLLAWEEVYEQGQNLPAEEFCGQHPELAKPLQERINALLKIEKQFGATGGMDASEPVRKADLDGQLDLGTQYSILRKHATGGLGEVYVAHDKDLQREVALKSIKPEWQRVADRKDRFLKEAQITGQLEHPGIVPVYGIGRTPDGQPVYAMRLIRGESLDEQIRECHQNGAPISEIRRLIRHLVSACRTVHYAHSRRILHCDLKPMNFMLGKFGETFVLDWGEAIVVNPHTLATEGPVPAAEEEGNHTDSAGGTIPYMPPERVDGSGTALQASADVYSLGVTLYRLVTGREAFQARNRQELIQKIIRGEYPKPRDIKPGTSRTLSDIIAKAMSINPEDRYDNAGRLADDLQCWLDDEPVSCHQERWSEWFSRVVRRHRAVALGGTLALIAVLFATTMVAVMETRTAFQRKEDLQAVERARESGLRALARLAAHQIEQNTESSWTTLETAAQEPDLPTWLATAVADPDTATELQQWLQELYLQHREGELKASSWFVLDAKGNQIGRFPRGKLSLTSLRNFAHKTYYHGGERELEGFSKELIEQGRLPSAIEGPHLSAVFWSSSDQCRKLAYSVPIWPEGEPVPVGVLVMTVRLEEVSNIDIELADDETDRHAMLIDIRPDWNDVVGSVLQHPEFSEASLDPEQIPHIAESVLNRLREIDSTTGNGRQRQEMMSACPDPIHKEERLAAISPVSVRSNGIGLFVIVCEPERVSESAE